jgi:hypothetical protein
VPLITIMSKFKSQNSKVQVKSKNFKTFDFLIVFLTFAFLLLTLVLSIAFSPHNLLNWQEFIGSIRYEIYVATGQTLVFYTRQFLNTIPVWFQLTKVFPYVLGWPIFILGILGFFGLSWKNKYFNLLRFAILVYFIPNAFLFAKWTRFMAPVFPLISVFAILFLFKLYDFLIGNIWTNSKVKIQNSKVQFKSQKFFTFNFLLLTFISILPGIAYLSIYQKPDVRFQASEWIYKNIPENAYILSETANVVDIPINNETMKQSNNYNIISFNFYYLDENPQLQEELKQHLEKADYIFVPSRRIFANHYCEKNFQFSLPRRQAGIFNFQSIFNNKCQILKQKYPILNQYYTDLFNGKLGFKKVAEFSAGLNDEQAEETWTVFDHPVIRIYRKVKS